MNSASSKTLREVRINSLTCTEFKVHIRYIDLVILYVFTYEGSVLLCALKDVMMNRTIGTIAVTNDRKSRDRMRKSQEAAAYIENLELWEPMREREKIKF